MRNVLVLMVLFCAIALGLFGCGGGGGGTTDGTTTLVKLTINWPARSRAVNAPSSALSCQVALSHPTSGDPVQTWTIDRPDNTAANTQQWTSPTRIPMGSYTLEVTFYAEANAVGAVVAEATTPITLAADGSGAGTITPESTIATVEVAAGQSVLIGETKALTFTARDASNAVVAATPGSATWAVTSGADKLQFVNGDAEGLAAGSAQVTATVDGKTSAAVAVTVTANTQLEEKIIFNVDKPGSSDLYMMNPDGSGVIQLTNTTDIDETHAAISPDGTKIAYISHPSTTEAMGSIRVMNSDQTSNSEIYAVTDPTVYIDNSRLDWSPDGTTLAFAEGHTGNLTESIFIINANGTGKTLVTTDGHNPSWSPDGQSIAFESQRTGDFNNLAIVNVNGSNRRLVTSFTEYDLGETAWSSQDRIAFHWYGYNYLIDPDGSNMQQLVQGYSPCFSPDGDSLAYVGEGGQTIYIRDASGTSTSRHSESGGYIGDIQWRRVVVSLTK